MRQVIREKLKLSNFTLVEFVQNYVVVFGVRVGTIALSGCGVTINLFGHEPIYLRRSKDRALEKPEFTYAYAV